MLLNSLLVPPTYKNLVTTLMCGKETIQLEEIRSNPLSFNIRKKANDENSQGEGLVVRSNQKRERNKSRSKSRNNKAQSKSRKRKDIQSYKWKNKTHKMRIFKEKKKERHREQREHIKVCECSGTRLKERYWRYAFCFI